MFASRVFGTTDVVRRVIVDLADVVRKVVIIMLEERIQMSRLPSSAGGTEAKPT